MTAVLAVGTLIVTPEDIRLLASLAREGARSIGSRSSRPLPRAVAFLLAAIAAAVLAAGTLMVSPGEVGLLAILVREGARVVGERRSLPRAVPRLVATVDAAAVAARFAAETAGGLPDVTTGGWATVTVAAEGLRVSPQFVRQLCRSGELIAERVGPVWVIEPDSLSAYALSRRREATR